MGHPEAQAALEAVKAHTDLFNDFTASFYGVSCDPMDKAEARVQDSYPGYRHFWDFDHHVSKLYGAAPVTPAPEGNGMHYRRIWYVLDPTLRVLGVVPFRPDGSDAAAVLAYMDTQPPPARFAGVELQVPIAFLPNVLEPKLCQLLIDYYKAQGSEESGFMREVDGKTVKIIDHDHKRRRDSVINDAELRQALLTRVKRRIVPGLVKTHQFHATRIKRYLVACYSAADSAHFNAHRENTTKGTAHRKFAVTINLNADYEGGDLTFPSTGQSGSGHHWAAPSSSPAPCCTQSLR